MQQHSSGSQKSRTKPKADAFDAWLDTTATHGPKCSTCAYGGQAVVLINRYAEAAKSGRRIPPVTMLLDHLQTNTGYPLDISSLRRHLKRCLGLTRGG